MANDTASDLAAGNSPSGAPSTGFFGHPAGLSTLFFTELWERFSYYGMRAILILFMTAGPAAGGLGLSVATAGAIYGMYASGVYMLSLPGGWIADRIVGQRRAVFIGGCLITLGQFCLAVPMRETFYVGLLIIVLGTGLLKPNISTMVGQIYAPGDHRRDAGFSIFYMGINIGALVAPLIVGYVGQWVDWHIAFALAGFGMIIGLIQYSLGGKRLGTAGLYPVKPPTSGNMKSLALILTLLALVIGLTAAAAAAGWVTVVGIANAFGVILLLTVVIFFGWLMISGSWTREERKRLAVVIVLFVAASLFWSAFEQAGSTLNLFADRSTRNSILGIPYPASWLQSVNAMFIVALAPVFAWLWVKLKDRNPSSPTKFVLGLIAMGLGFAILACGALLAAGGERVSPMWLIATYLLHTVGELCLSPVGLSTVTKLAPVRVAGLIMGMWFLSNSVGNYLGGRLASFYESFPVYGLFGAVAVFSLATGLVLALLVPTTKRMMGGVR